MTAVATPPTPTFRVLKTKFSSAVRHDQMAGKKYLVAPMIMLTEGVHSGSNGPLFYPASEIQKLPETWNMKPVVVYHPEGEGGTAISACSKTVIDSQGVGVIMNAKVIGGLTKDGKKLVKLSAEAWMEETRLEKVDKRVLEALEKGKPMEVSTGVWTENEATSGKWNDEAYDVIARNYHPDHLALLPDLKGACSLDDGAGLLIANEASFDSRYNLIRMACDEKFGQYNCYIIDVFNSFFVYSKGGKLYQLNYSATDTKATLSGEPAEVVRVVQYRSPDGAVIANLERNFDMDRKKLIDAIILSANGFAESDRNFLETRNDSQLQVLHTKTVGGAPGAPAAPLASLNTAAQAGAAGVNPAPAPVPTPPTTNTVGAPPAPAPVPVPTPAPAPVPTAAENRAALIAAIRTSDPAFASMISNGLKAHDGQRQALISTIKANTRNTFTDEQLGQKTFEDLQQLSALAGSPSLPPGMDALAGSGAPNYAMLGDAFGGVPFQHQSSGAPGLAANVGHLEPTPPPTFKKPGAK